MAKIKSTRTTVLEPKEQIQGTILIEVNSPTHDILNGNIRCTLNFYHMEELRLLSSETWNLPNDKRNQLLEASLNEESSQQIDMLLSQFLLEKFQLQSKYGLLSNEWIILEAAEFE